jgi:DNA-binding SARP family transcriptional activator
MAYLALESPRRHPRDAVAEMFWSRVPSAQARHSLRQTLTEIRSTLGDDGRDYLVTTDDTIAIRAEALRVDALLLERCVRRATSRSLAAACALYQGELLAGVNIHESAFEIWLTHHRVRLRQLAIDAHELCAQRLVARGDQSNALAVALRLLAIDPLNERGQRLLIALYADRGQFGAAMRQYESFARALRDELGIRPERKTEELLRTLLSGRNTG